MSRPISRRRVVTILAAAAGLPLLLKAGEARARPVRWEGEALGAQASLAVYHEDEAAARTAIQAGIAELRRLEGLFSLYRADSAVATLNREGRLDDAPAELVALLGAARRYGELTGGAFDITVQPLWQLYLRHFATAAPGAAGPAPRDLEAALALVDWRGVEIDESGRRVRFARPGMGVTLNGIAQGHITDCVAEVLRAQGLERMLVDMGEPRAMAAHPDGRAWRIGIAHPADPLASVTTLEVVDRAVATSGGYGTLFDAAGRFTHLIDPASGRTAPAAHGVTVVADRAVTADALSTALAVAPPERRAAIVAAAGIEALFVTPEGEIARLAA